MKCQNQPGIYEDDTGKQLKRQW